MSATPVRVLIVEDEALAAEAHAAYVERLEGFELAGVARSAAAALRALDRGRADGVPVDLLLLDLHLPDGHGLGLLQRARAAGHLCDAIAVTSARDADVVRHAVAQGVVLYLLKPFTFAGFRAKLGQYADYRRTLAGAGEVGQDDVDSLLGALRTARAEQRAALPKGMSPETMAEVVAALRRHPQGLSATEAAEQVGASRVTVRRYLEHLAENGQADRRPRYGVAGRPELEYRWR
ncbi:response regulator [Nocardioides fonticola]|uniref:Transcriptional regulatory protein n=1 Tax=Nocardioides fonticola TaxID=450363 RepID=A0ABP7XKH9_9ACTN